MIEMVKNDKNDQKMSKIMKNHQKWWKILKNANNIGKFNIMRRKSATLLLALFSVTQDSSLRGVIRLPYATHYALQKKYLVLATSRATSLWYSPPCIILRDAGFSATPGSPPSINNDKGPEATMALSLHTSHIIFSTFWTFCQWILQPHQQLYFYSP